jgi:hypothetical protein
VVEVEQLYAKPLQIDMVHLDQMAHFFPVVKYGRGFAWAYPEAGIGGGLVLLRVVRCLPLVTGVG